MAQITQPLPVCRRYLQRHSHNLAKLRAGKRHEVVEYYANQDSDEKLAAYLEGRISYWTIELFRALEKGT